MGDNRHPTEVARLLQKCLLFSNLEQADLVTLATYATRRKCLSGEPIFHAGDSGESLMGVLVGTVRIARHTVEGGEMILADLSAGEILGEIAVLDGRGRSADAVALTNCELAVLERRDVIPFLEQRPALCVDLLRLLCAKIRQADDRSSDFLFLDLSARLAKILVDRAERAPQGDQGAKLALTQSELGRMVGATRSNVNRQLKKWQRSGIIDLRKGWIVVIQRQRLAELAGRG